MRRLQIYLILIALLAFLAAFAYYYGVAVTAILLVVILSFYVNMRSFRVLKALIVESQRISGENDRKIYKKLQQIEENRKNG